MIFETNPADARNNKDEKKYLKVKLKSEAVLQEWETEFELPA